MGHLLIMLYLPELMIENGAVENIDTLIYHGSLISPPNADNPSQIK